MKQTTTTRSGRPRRRQPTQQRPTKPLRHTTEILAGVTCTVREACHATGLKRTTFFSLLSAKVIESGLIHTPGREKSGGVRLVNVESLKNYLSNATNGNPS